MAYFRFEGMPLLMQLEFSATSLLGLIGSLALGIGFAWALYSSSGSLPQSLRKALFTVRSLLVAMLTFLLFAPLVKFTSKSVEKPLIIVAQDNSASIGISPARGFDAEQYANSLSALHKKLREEFEVRTFSFGSGPAEGLNFKFDQRTTNISSLFRLISDRFTNRNIGAVILASDGIYNQGGNPQYESQALGAPVYTVALGDTIPKKDILVSNVSYNNLAYLNNRFQIEVNLEAFQSRGNSSTLTVRDKSGIIFSKGIEVISQEFRQTVPVTLPAKAKGVQKFVVSVAPVPGELSRQNNSQTIYVEVIDGRQNILLIANSPHPDIAAIKSAIEQNDNYQVEVRLAEVVQPGELAEADLLILHQVPGLNKSHQEILRQVGNKPAFFILGAQSNTSAFSAFQPVLSITSPGTTQEVHARVRGDFYAFTLSEVASGRLANFAPLLTPFGNYAVKGPLSVLLTQQVGNVSTDQPLLAFAEEGGRKVGVLAGEGIWRWRLEEFQESGSHDALNELIGKSIQYLVSKDDKRKFRVYTGKNTFDENERVVLNAELYNEAYELVNSPEVAVTLKSGDGKRYSYNFSRNGNSYVLDAGILPAGEYGYTANTQLGSKKYKASGQFIVAQQQAEYQQTTANHQLLHSMAYESGGQMVFPERVRDIPRLIKANEDIKTISYENKRYEELIDMEWIFFLLLGLLAVEWFVRKRNGEA